MRASVADEVVGRGPSALWLEEGDFFESQSLLCKGTGKGEDVASVGNREQRADGKGWGWGHLIAGWATALSPFFALRSALRTSLFLRTMICDGVPANVEFFLKTLLGLVLLLLCAAAAAATARSAQHCDVTSHSHDETCITVAAVTKAAPNLCSILESPHIRPPTR